MSLRRPGLVLAVALALAACSRPTASPDTAAASAPAVADAATAPAAKIDSETGVLEKAPYRIDVPANWNGELVMYLHGYEPVGSERARETEQDDFDRGFLAKGYAVAKSAYSAQGWAIAEALEDNERLRRHAVQKLGKPKRTWLIGHSMGAHLALASLERHSEHYDGALAFCGVNAPASELFSDGVLPPLVAFDYLFPGVLPTGPAGLADPASPPWPDPDAIDAALAKDEARAALLAARYGILRKDLAGGLMIRYAVLHELASRSGGFPADNQDAVYDGLGDDAAVNAGVRRYAGDPKAIAYVAERARLTGYAPKPVVILSNHDDPTVPAEISARYAAMAEASGNGANVLTLPPTGHGHCNFELADGDRAFEVLAQWVRTGQR